MNAVSSRMQGRLNIHKNPTSGIQKSICYPPTTFQDEKSQHTEEGKARPPSTKVATKHAACVTGNANGCLPRRDARPGFYQVLSGGVLARAIK